MAKTKKKSIPKSIYPVAVDPEYCLCVFTFNEELIQMAAEDLAKLMLMRWNKENSFPTGFDGEN